MKNKSAKEYWKEKFDEYPQNDSEKLAVVMMQEYAQEVVKNLNIPAVSGSLLSDIRDEMDADMEDSGMAQGEIESCLTHWGNKYIIQRKEWFSNNR